MPCGNRVPARLSVSDRQGEWVSPTQRFTHLSRVCRDRPYRRDPDKTHLPRLRFLSKENYRHQTVPGNQMPPPVPRKVRNTSGLPGSYALVYESLFRVTPSMWSWRAGDHLRSEKSVRDSQQSVWNSSFAKLLGRGSVMKQNAAGFRLRAKSTLVAQGLLSAALQL